MKKVFKIISLVLVISLLLSLTCIFASCDKADETLVVYNWADYIDEAVLEDFTEYYYDLTGKTIDVTYSTFDTNETMITKLTSGDAKVDVICPSEYAIQKLYNLNLLQKIDFANVPSYSNIIAEIPQKVDIAMADVLADSLNDYMVPYMWGTLGILYNADVVTEEDLSENWGLLWNKNNNEELNGRILMKDSIRDAYIAGTMYLKQYDLLPDNYKNLTNEQLINTVDDTLLELLETAFTEQKAVLKGYEVDLGKDDLIKGTAYVDFAWSGDALYAIEEAKLNNVNLKYFVPNNEGNIWFDGWVVPTIAQNKYAAEVFIDYLCKPEVAVKNLVACGYSSAVKKEVLQNCPDAIEFLRECEYHYDIDEFFADETRYPSIINSNELGVMRDFGDKNELVATMWERVKSTVQNSTWIYICIVVAVVAILIAVIVIFNSKKFTKKKKKRVVIKP